MHRSFSLYNILPVSLRSDLPNSIIRMLNLKWRSPILKRPYEIGNESGVVIGRVLLSRRL